MRKYQHYIFSIVCSSFILIGAACSKGNEQKDPTVYVTLKSGTEVLMDVRGSVAETAGRAHARISTQDISGPGGDVRKNTVGIVANVVTDMESGKMQSLVITVPNVVGPDTYDIVKEDGLFVYSDSRTGMKGGEVSPEAESSQGTITIEAIGGSDLPGLGKAVKGTFSVTAKGLDGTLLKLNGSFNGGL